MAAVTRLGLYGGPRPPYAGFSAAAASAAISGTAASGLTESQIVTGGETIIITLTNDTWVASGATFNAQRQAIIDGITAAESEATGWNAEVRDKEVVGAVARTSDTVVTITLTAAAAYDVTANETITVTIPAAALVTSSIDVVASPTIGVTADVAVEDTGATGGFWYGYEREMARRERERKKRKKAKRKAQKVKDELERQIAIAERELEEEEARKAELARLNRLVANNADMLESYGERVTFVMLEALERQTYSTMERLEREIAQLREEELFLIEATRIIING